MKQIDKTHVRIFGMCRSGNHLIIEWLRSILRGRVLFLNNIIKGKNPFDGCVGYRVGMNGSNSSDLVSDLLCFLYNSESKKFRGTKLLNRISKMIYKQEDFIRRKFFPHISWDYLLYSYEDRFLSDFFNNEERQVADIRLRAKEKYDILILRDPYNLFASRLNVSGIWEDMRTKRGKDNACGMWKEYAKEFLGLCEWIEGDKIVINYNNFVLEKEYREAVAERFHVQNKETVLDKFHSRLGSSFHGGERVSGRKGEEFLERWKRFEGDEWYKSIFFDGEINELSSKIFGNIEGIQYFLSNINGGR